LLSKKKQTKIEWDEKSFEHFFNYKDNNKVLHVVYFPTLKVSNIIMYSFNIHSNRFSVNSRADRSREEYRTRCFNMGSWTGNNNHPMMLIYLYCVHLGSRLLL